ncbi:MAG: response regulator, partial [Candidatus Promineifilaceae bacterium]|nr:response regulator [Candidatus Promineifilaceae bacterium]
MEKTPLVLIVDDEPFNVDYLEQELEDLEYDTISAGNGQEALEQVEAHAPDMILLDIMMPVMDGFGALEHLKADKRWRDIPVVVISAMSDMDSVVRGIELGAEDYLPKPFDPVLLEARLTAGLEKKRLRDIEVEYLQQVEKLTKAAAAVQNSTFDAEKLADVAGREDALGNLARVFQNMAHEVHAREQRLRQQIQQLRQDQEDQRGAAAETADRYIPMDRRQALARGESLPEMTNGAALFADISGFTPLTAAFAAELGKKRGAEEMTRLIKRVFSVLIAEVHQYGGSVIGFSGDAITCWFDGQAILRAAACALAMQEAMAVFAAVLTPGGSTVSLTLKVALAAGTVRRLVVGNPAVQLVEVLAGLTMDELDLAHHMAQAGEVVVSEDTVHDYMYLGEWRASTGSATVANGESRVAVVTGLRGPVTPAPWPALEPLADDLARAWLLRPAYEMIQEGASHFMSELRRTHALFMKFEGIDFDADPLAGEKLDQFLRWAQGIIDHYGGHVLQLST